MAMAGALRLGVIIALNNKLAMAKLGQMEKRVGRFGGALKKMSAGFAVGGAVIAGGLAVSVKAAADFEQALANTNSVANATGEELRKMKQLAFDMAKTTTASATESANAMYSLASAGQKAGEIMQTLPGIIKLSTATAFDLGTTTTTVVSTLKQFKLQTADTGRVTNVFAAAIGSSMANMEKLSTSMSYVGPVANAAGMSLEDTTAALSLLYDAGLDGSMAGTALRRVLQSMIDPTDNLRKRLLDAGVSVGNLTPGMSTLGETLDAVKASGIDLTDVFADFGARGATAALTLIDEGSAGLGKMTQSITGTDTVTSMLAKQMATLHAQLTIAKNTLQVFAIRLGEKLMPLLKKGVEWVKNMADKLGTLSSRSIEMIAKIAGITAVTFVLVSAVGKLSAVLGAATGPIGLIILAIGGLVMAFQWAGKTLGTYHDLLREGKTEEAEAMRGKAKFAAFMRGLFTGAFWKAVWKDLKEGAKLMAAVFVALVRTGVESMKRLKDVLNPKNWFKKDFWAGLKDDMLGKFQESLKAVVEEWEIDIPEGGKSFTDAYLNALMDPTTEAAKALGLSAGEGFGEGFQEAVVESMGEWQGPPMPPAAALPEGPMLGPSEEEWAAWKSRYEELQEFAQTTADKAIAVGDEFGAELMKKETKWLKTMGKMTKAFLVDTLKDIVAQKAKQALASKVVAVGEALMKGVLDIKSLAMIPVILSAYAATVAGLGKIRSFHTGGVPYESIVKVRPRREGVVDLPTAQRGGFGAGYMALAGAGVGGAGIGPTVHVEIHMRDVKMVDPEADAEVMAKKLGDLLANEINREL